MAVGEATVLIARSADEILDFVMDVEAYRAVNPRVDAIEWVRRVPGQTVVRFRPRLMGIPGPMTTQRVTLTPGHRVDIVPEPGQARGLAAFTGVLECTTEGGFTRVRRRLELRLVRPLSWLLDRPLARWLAKDVPAELVRLKSHMEDEPEPDWRARRRTR